MKTINCRDDSLYEDRGMWTSMKKTKRCIVVAQGFYEWLKKNNGKEKIPHFTKRKDGQLMCFAGLWDCAQFEGERVLVPVSIATSTWMGLVAEALRRQRPPVFGSRSPHRRQAESMEQARSGVKRASPGS